MFLCLLVDSPTTTSPTDPPSPLVFCAAAAGGLHEDGHTPAADHIHLTATHATTVAYFPRPAGNAHSLTVCTLYLWMYGFCLCQCVNDTQAFLRKIFFDTKLLQYAHYRGKKSCSMQLWVTFVAMDDPVSGSSIWSLPPHPLGFTHTAPVSP